MELEVHSDVESLKGSKTAHKIQSWELKEICNTEPYSFEIRLHQLDGSTMRFVIRKEAVLELHRVSNRLYLFTWKLHKVRYNLKMRESSCVSKIVKFFKYVCITECGGSQLVKTMLSKVLYNHTNVTDLTGKVFPKGT